MHDSPSPPVLNNFYFENIFMRSIDLLKNLNIKPRKPWKKENEKINGAFGAWTAVFSEETTSRRRPVNYETVMISVAWRKGRVRVLIIKRRRRKSVFHEFFLPRFLLRDWDQFFFQPDNSHTYQGHARSQVAWRHACTPNSSFFAKYLPISKTKRKIKIYRVHSTTCY